LEVNFSVNPVLGVPGQVVSFTGNLTNITSNEVFINSVSYTFDISGAGVLDDSPFLLNAPLSLGPLGISPTFEFFTVTTPLSQAAGIYSGILTVLGGADDQSFDVLGDGTFSLQVGVASAGVPEPATVLLLGGGMGLLVWRHRRS
jgi:hypothetical protein